VRRHRPLEDYLRAPIAPGFTLSAFLEPALKAESL